MMEKAGVRPTSHTLSALLVRRRRQPVATPRTLTHRLSAGPHPFSTHPLTPSSPRLSRPAGCVLPGRHRGLHRGREAV